MNPTKQDYLKAIATEIHKPARKVFPRRHVHASKKDEVWSMDLVDMSEWKDDNDGEKFMLTIVDVFTRSAWAKPMASKSALDTFAAFISIVDSSKRKPEKIWVDLGKEFYNSYFNKWMANNSCIMYSTFGESKSVIVERFNKTLKTKMWFYFTEFNTRRWIDQLPLLMKWYNTRVHSTIKMSPIDASKRKNHEVVNTIINPPVVDKGGITRKARYTVGDVVRISRTKGIFEKGYLPNYSRETFTVVEVQTPFSKEEPIVYRLQDSAGEVLQGSFYDEELGSVKYPDVFLIEDTLQTKKIKGKLYHLVKWLGYSSKMNSWIPDSDVLD